jgi:hypothetical protein
MRACSFEPGLNSRLVQNTVGSMPSSCQSRNDARHHSERRTRPTVKVVMIKIEDAL